MSKYDFEVDLSQNSSTGIILSKIHKGAVVLEFGCAAGRMTRYMKETLGCQVYIVEYEKSAFEKASQYAEDGCCCDIMTFEWAQKFSGIQFDAIIFADVLEHLTAPEKALRRAAEFLKDTGSVYVSIPNITHNDILLKAYEEHFDYTSVGLLDDTHVHFWGFENLKQLAEQSGLSLQKVEGTTCPTYGTEQYAQQTEKRGNHLLVNLLKERQCGEIYQFILTLKKNAEAEPEYVLPKAAYKSHIYLDTGAGFNPNEIIGIESGCSGQGSSFTLQYILRPIKGLKRVRLDPIEFQPCILQHLSIKQGEKDIGVFYHNWIELEDGILLLGEDPQLYTEELTAEAPISISADVLLPGNQYIETLQSSCAHQHSEIDNLKKIDYELQGKISELAVEKIALKKRVSDVMTQVNELQQRNAALTAKNEETNRILSESEKTNKMLGERLEALTAECEETKRVLGGYIVLANQKDSYAIELEQVVEHYKNMEVVRLRTWILRCLRGVKRRLMRLAGKGEQK